MTDLNSLVGRGLVYLATPYTRYPHGREAAFQQACYLAIQCVKAGVTVFSPIVHSHPLTGEGKLDPVDGALWEFVDAPFLARCNFLLVATLEGWQDSRGIAHEIKVFERLGKPIGYLEPFTMEVLL
jgi:hypothetical protein